MSRDLRPTVSRPAASRPAASRPAASRSAAIGSAAIRRTVIVPTAIVLGALCWIAKVAVILATNGRVTDEGVAGLLFAVGGGLLLVGAIGLGIELTRSRGGLLRAGAGLGAALALAVSVIVLAVLASAVVPATVPQYLTDEVSTLLASIGWAGIAIWAYRRSRPA